MDAASPPGREIGVAAAAGRLRLDAAQGSIPGTVAAGLELPFADRSVDGFRLAESVAGLSVRDRVQLLMECRRALRPGGRVRLPASATDAVFGALARWAALVGLTEPGDGTCGWRKHLDAGGATPLVSILIPASNPRYFRACLESAAAQTYPHIEIIVCDDSPGPEIEAVARSLGRRAPIDYHRNTPRLRARRNYEKLLGLARGDYIKFLNDDDLLAPECIATLLRPLVDHPDLALATSHRQPIDGNSRPLPDMPATRPVVAADTLVSGVSLANATIMYGLNVIGEPSTLLLRKRDFAWRAHLDGERPFHFNGEEVRGAADLAMASRVLVQGDAAFLHARLSSFRRHGEQAQARADVVARSVAGIRGLQRQWIELGLFRRMHPNLLETRPLGADGHRRTGWALTPALTFPPTGNLPAEDLRRWRATTCHPFDFVAAGTGGALRAGEESR